MSSYKELLAKRAELDAQIEKARRAELDDAIRQARELVAQFNLTAADIFGSGAGAAKPAARLRRGTVAPKYRDPATGQTWTGRGKAPKWIEGKDRAAFLIG